MAVALGTPFISGKDSLNNEFSYFVDGQKQTIAIPAVAADQRAGADRRRAQCVTMDLKQAGNLLYQVGVTRDELGGSHYALVSDLDGGAVPEGRCRGREADLFDAVHRRDRGRTRAELATI